MIALWLAGLALADEGAALEGWGDLGETPTFVEGGVDGEAVVNGEPAEKGRWDDAAAIVFYGQYVSCTGVLIAPQIVLTAEHCVGGISHVILGSTDYYSREGVMIEVTDTIASREVDIAVLLLAEEAPYAPRPVATDCIRDEYLKDGAEVAVVGYGATRSDGRGDTSVLHEGLTYIQDADCSETRIDGMYTGCGDRGTELGAGGNDVDACFGDSGGPLYILTERGDFVAGITSRAYAGAPSSAPCLYGGIYGRPDAVLDWIEEVSDMVVPRPQCNDAPDPSAARIVTGKNDEGITRVKANDPDGAPGEHTYEIVDRPQHGKARVSDSGKVTYTPDRGYTGKDALTVAVTDAGSPDYAGSAPITSDVDVAVVVEGGMGCSALSARPVGWLALLLAPLVAARRRR